MGWMTEQKEFKEEEPQDPQDKLMEDPNPPARPYPGPVLESFSPTGKDSLAGETWPVVTRMHSEIN